MKIKILFVIGSMNGGGAERVLLEILKYLDQSIFEAFLAIGSLSGEYKDEIPNHVKVIDMSSSYHIFIKNIIVFNNIIKRNDIKLVVSFMPNANLIALRTKFLFRPNLKVVLTEHNNPHRNYLSSKSKIKNFIKKLDLFYFYKYADKIVTVSDGIRSELIKKFNILDHKIITIYNPADIKGILNKTQIIPKFFTDKIKLKKNIIAIGRLVEQKGYFDMLQIVKKLNDKIPVQLIILGEGPLRESIEKKIDELELSNSVFMLGFVENPWSYINNSDVYLSTSLWEGFHMTIVESMACGVYPIVSDCNYGPNEIIINNEMGKLIPLNANQQFVDQLYNFLIKHEKGYKYSACIERSHFFDSIKIVNQYVSLFKTI
ncbi:glycosyltransferase [Polaribacter sp. BAL334]|uniref:glycosyltransferase n=1 Tax=Polaribacter sp. BAL334 TaxID=1708178 RepID=UPI0018D26BA4|nr:glycosyltransferase [Polaribacter sp. BAL334]MBG7611722.1 glycosyltransferase [Polaribacter sp. BAL334]